MRVGPEIQAMLRSASRITPGSLLVRAIAFGAGIVAAGIAMPVSLMSPEAMFSAVVLAALAASRPGSVLVGLVQLCTVVLWFIGTSLDAAPPFAPALIGLACALYAQHAACALAAAIPLDAVVLPAVLSRWFARVGVVMLITAILGGIMIILPTWLHPSPLLMFPLLGMVGVILMAGLLAYLVFRPPRRDA
jgi:hypothetical protein